MPLTSKRNTRFVGEKVNIHTAGTIDGYETIEDVVFDPTQYECSTARLVTVFHSLQTGLVALLYWGHVNGEHELIMPVEGRGILAFDRFDGLQNPRFGGLDGSLIMRVYQQVSGEPDQNTRHFALSFELFKQQR